MVGMENDPLWRWDCVGELSQVYMDWGGKIDVTTCPQTRLMSAERTGSTACLHRGAGHSLSHPLGRRNPRFVLNSSSIY